MEAEEDKTKDKTEDKTVGDDKELEQAFTFGNDRMVLPGVDLSYSECSTKINSFELNPSSAVF